MVVAKVLVMAVNALVELLATDPVPRALPVVPESRLLPSELVVLPRELPSELVVEPNSDEVVCDRLLVSLAGLVSGLVVLSSELVSDEPVPVEPEAALVSEPVVPESRPDRLPVAAPVPVLAALPVRPEVVPLSAEPTPESNPPSEELVCDVSVSELESEPVPPDSRLDSDELASCAVLVPVSAEVVPERTLPNVEPSVLPSVEVAAWAASVPVLDVPLSAEVVPESRLPRAEPTSVTVLPSAPVVPDTTVPSVEPTSESVLPRVEVAA